MNATMYGLRFDSGRQTHLKKNTPVSINKTFTLSAWIKRTSSSVAHMVATSSGDAHRNYYVHPDTNELGVYEANGLGDVSLGSNITVPLNVWTHVVFQKDGDTISGFINNTPCGAPKTMSSSFNTTIFSIGRANSDNVNFFDGYMSDFYLVDNVALEPTLFGYALEDGTWAPLDSSAVTVNVESLETPYDTRPNYDQKWSDSLSSSGTIDPSFPATNAFEGTNAFCQCNAGNETLTFDITSNGLVYSDKVEVMSASVNAEFVVNDDSANPVTSAGVYEWNTVATGGGTLNKIDITSDNNASLAQIRVDGRLLIDGPADNSQVWSDELCLKVCYRMLMEQSLMRCV